MIISLRKCQVRARFALVFCALTIALYWLYGLFSAWIEPVERYKEPSGHAVKAFYDTDYYSQQGSFADRLRFFYWYGE